MNHNPVKSNNLSNMKKKLRQSIKNYNKRKKLLLNNNRIHCICSSIHHKNNHPCISNNLSNSSNNNSNNNSNNYNNHNILQLNPNPMFLNLLTKVVKICKNLVAVWVWNKCKCKSLQGMPPMVISVDLRMKKVITLKKISRKS